MHAHDPAIARPLALLITRLTDLVFEFARVGGASREPLCAWRDHRCAGADCARRSAAAQDAALGASRAVHRRQRLRGHGAQLRCADRGALHHWPCTWGVLRHRLNHRDEPRAAREGIERDRHGLHRPHRRAGDRRALRHMDRGTFRLARDLPRRGRAGRDRLHRLGFAGAVEPAARGVAVAEATAERSDLAAAFSGLSDYRRGLRWQLHRLHLSRADADRGDGPQRRVGEPCDPALRDLGRGGEHRGRQAVGPDRAGACAYADLRGAGHGARTAGAQPRHALGRHRGGAVLGGFAFGNVPPLQANVVDIARNVAPGAVDVASGLNIGAFNLGIAGGAWIGGLAVDQLGLSVTPFLGAMVVLGALALTRLSGRLAKSAFPQPAE